MKTSLKLNSKTSLRALESKARQASLLSQLPSSSSDEKKKTENRKAKKNRSTTVTPLERSLRSIVASLKAHLAKDLSIVVTQPSKGASCVKIIQIYNQAEMMRQKEEEILRRQLAKENGTGYTGNSFKAKPVVTYAFYSSSFDNTKLGSVAIYCSDVLTRLFMIRKNGTLFGFPVISAEIENGLRPFIDVKVRA